MNYNPDEPAASSADVLREITALRLRCLAILDDAAAEGSTIESAAFVDCTRAFADALIDFGCEISPTAAEAATTLEIPPPFLCFCDDCEPDPPHQLLIKAMSQLLQRVAEEATCYASAVGRPDERAKLWRLSGTAVVGGISIGCASRMLIVWNSERAGRSNADIAGQLGIPVDRVPEMIASAKAYLGSWPKPPPT
ncbi:MULTISPECIES: hypothetical protein [unclassified Amycolatopsis]|uniref:hypothetical protein n=1 Tax=unclassified Amycolatopsis TaxID=2618356 RepID=UPI002874DDB7|nr:MULTISPECIES: hypothetical protein [unclassified Amycolatopsis]MDS0140577.1 hypothetical protein [Amycolatopsis sp. 505]MDS0149227.1 hypothetical protein [Amycolatopsis sp. CM201R]